ncbi:MAG: TldD/PmbA family protein [Asgard group archaeon]|nr:TldD/PmbA family protein [Asgard group archaeon]
MPIPRMIGNFGVHRIVGRANPVKSCMLVMVVELLVSIIFELVLLRRLLLQMDLNKDLLKEKGQLVLKEAEKLGATQVEVSVRMSQTALTRLANSIVDQNVAENHARVRTIVYLGKRKGSTSVEIFDDDSIKQAVADAIKIAKISPENKDFKSLPEPKPMKPIPVEEQISKNTLDATPEKRAEFATVAIDNAHAVDKRIKAVAGAISHGFAEEIILNSLGVEAYDLGTFSNVNLTVLADDGSEESAGWYADNNKDFTKLNIQKVSEIAAKKAADGFGMKYIDPGNYEVILEPAAVGGFMFFMSYFGFSAMMYQDYISFLRDKIGEKLFSEKLNLWDDAFDKRNIYRGFFDDEGHPKTKLDMIKAGVVKNLAYDTMTADKDGVKSTGHNAKFRGRSMPYPGNLLIGEGNSNLDEMIAETKKGILVTHFHYQNAVNPTKGIFTGLTRDGAWLVENGEIKCPLRTLRYTDSCLRFLAEIDLVGKYPEINSTFARVPAIKLPSFTITGSQKE